MGRQGQPKHKEQLIEHALPGQAMAADPANVYAGRLLSTPAPIVKEASQVAGWLAGTRKSGTQVIER